MKTERTLIIAGCIGFAFFLLLGIPATLITSLGGSDSIRFSGVSGTVWHGEVRHAKIQGMSFRDISWDLHGQQLLLGRLAGDIEARLPAGSARGTVALGLGGSITLRDLEGKAAAGPLGKLLNLPQAAGQIQFQIADLRIRNGWPKRITGTASVMNFPLLPDGSAPGSFEVVFATESVSEDGIIDGTLKDLDGPLEITGAITLMPPANYELTGIVRARGDAPKALTDGLALLGPVDAGGRREFSLAGSI
jgi:hypothetical protein